jgi:hypothetical protein
MSILDRPELASFALSAPGLVFHNAHNALRGPRSNDLRTEELRRIDPYARYRRKKPKAEAGL